MSAIRDKRVEEMFSAKPDAEKFEKARDKIKDIYNFTEQELDGLRYFCCFVKDGNVNHSLTKSLYFESKTKGLGKTSIIRALAAVLNGDKDTDNAGDFESDLSKELQFNAHDLPKSAQYRTTIMDEVLPRDGNRVYNKVKSHLTRTKVSFNQKFGRIIDVPIKPFYLFASNDPLHEFIPDDYERRFIQIIMHEKPKQLDFPEIYEMFKEFAIHATPRLESWKEWYDSFDLVHGIHTTSVEDYKSYILNDDYILSELQSKEDGNPHISRKWFYDKMEKGRLTRDDKKAITDALTELFGEMKNYRWYAPKVIEKIKDYRYTADIDGNVPEVEGDDEDMPF